MIDRITAESFQGVNITLKITPTGYSTEWVFNVKGETEEEDNELRFAEDREFVVTPHGIEMMKAFFGTYCEERLYTQTLQEYITEITEALSD